MSTLEIRDIDTPDEYFVGTCTHVGESDEIDACALRRVAWLRSMYEKGLRVKVAVFDSERIGFLYVMPIEVCPWGPIGRDLLVIPCLCVLEKSKHRGVGRALTIEAEKEARRQDRKGIVTIGYYHDFWFMPAPFFERCGFSVVKRKGDMAILWKVFNSSAEVPRFLESNYQFKQIAGKVVVDLFWNTFCETSDIEAQRVREVVADFGQSVVLHEYCADDRKTLFRYQIPRGIFINGKEIFWGYEAPKEGIRETISQALRDR